LIKALEDTSLRDNTIIMFTGDHGDMLGERGMVQKRHFYEWSTRVPLIITYPDRRHAGTKVSQPVSLVDLAPTILDIAGVEERFPLDGEGLLDLMGDHHTDRRDIFSEMHTAGVFATCFMIRKGRFKYNYTHQHDSQLFDLEEDPEEWTNLAGTPGHRAIEEELKTRILDQFDPDQIEKDVSESLLKRRLIREAMRANDTNWDFSPHFDATQQFVRRKPPVQT
jgi:choline-sulfatase